MPVPDDTTEQLPVTVVKDSFVEGNLKAIFLHSTFKNLHSVFAPNLFDYKSFFSDNKNYGLGIKFLKMKRKSGQNF